MFNKNEAAEFIGISVRTLENYMKDGRIVPTYEKALKSRPVAKFAETDLQKLKSEVDAAKGVSATVNAASAQTVPETTDTVSAIVPATKTAEFPKAVPEANYSLNGQDLATLIDMAAQSRGVVDPASLVAKFLLTISEAMALSGIKEKPLRDAIKAGQLKSIRIGRSIQVRPEDLKAWVDSQF